MTDSSQLTHGGFANGDRPRPRITDLNRPFFEGLREGRLLLQRCQACETCIFYPREICPECLSTALEWTPVSGLGSVASFAHVHKPQHPAFSAEIPITLIAVELDEGALMFSRLVGSGAQSLQVGTRVAAVFVGSDDNVRQQPELPLFSLAPDE